jgi:hypothetical protein
MKSTFREWSLDKIDATFNLREVWELPILNTLLSYEYQCSEYETQYLTELARKYKLGGEDWNEAELESKIIGPLFSFADIDNRAFAYFVERELSATIGEYDLVGKVDGMVATGFRNPKKPFFCMNEYKRATDPDGDPKGQALIAMLVAQAINDNAKPILGCYIVGRQWCFIALEGKEYAFSTAFTCDNEDIFDIHRILRSLRVEIEKLIA